MNECARAHTWPQKSMVLTSSIEQANDQTRLEWMFSIGNHKNQVENLPLKMENIQQKT